MAFSQFFVEPTSYTSGFPRRTSRINSSTDSSGVVGAMHTSGIGSGTVPGRRSRTTSTADQGNLCKNKTTNATGSNGCHVSGNGLISEQGMEESTSMSDQDRKSDQNIGANKFIFRNGSKLHSFKPEEAPWPFCFNREVLEQCALDHALILRIRDNLFFTEFNGKNSPTRVLDLGTAMGDWVIDCAQRFPECTFVGFDLVNIQIPLSILDSSVAERIEWVHGNFLTDPLPFEDNEFDFIHMEGIALGVPEDKWHWLFGELHRVLKLGGHVELIQQDALFPVLPRWFTQPLHSHLEKRTPLSNLPGRAHQSFLPSTPANSDLPHDHALLESLFYGAFDSRWINSTPSSLLPDYFSATFRHVSSPPILRFPMPPIAPLIPRPEDLEDVHTQMNNDCSQSQPGAGLTSDPMDASNLFLPTMSSNEESNSVEARIRSLTEPVVSSNPTSATGSTTTLADTDSGSFLSDSTQDLSLDSVGSGSEQAVHLERVTLHKNLDGRNSTFQPHSRSGSTSRLSLDTSSPVLQPISDATGHPTSPHSSISPSSVQLRPGVQRQRSVAVLTPTETSSIGPTRQTSAVFRIERLQSLGDEGLFMHLYQAVKMVLALKEAMWDELKERVLRRDKGLETFGWGAVPMNGMERNDREGEGGEGIGKEDKGSDWDLKKSRLRFEALIERYSGDMQVRMSLWHSLVKYGWTYPRREPLSTVEIYEEERLRQDILEARKNATEDEFAMPTRSIRLLLGMKGE